MGRGRLEGMGNHFLNTFVEILPQEGIRNLLEFFAMWLKLHYIYSKELYDGMFSNQMYKKYK